MSNCWVFAPINTWLENAMSANSIQGFQSPAITGNEFSGLKKYWPSEKKLRTAFVSLVRCNAFPPCIHACGKAEEAQYWCPKHNLVNADNRSDPSDNKDTDRNKQRPDIMGYERLDNRNGLNAEGQNTNFALTDIIEEVKRTRLGDSINNTADKPRELTSKTTRKAVSQSESNIAQDEPDTAQVFNEDTLDINDVPDQTTMRILARGQVIGYAARAQSRQHR